MSDQSLAIADTTEKSVSRREYRRRQPAIDGQPSDPILTQYTYSTADDEYRCLRCPYRNRRPQYIRDHMFSHSDRRPYQCPDCTAAFKRHRDFRRHHQNCHQLLRPYVCPHEGCHKRYPRLQSLKVHIDGKHSPLGCRCLLEGCKRKRPFACLKHLRVHQHRRHYHRLAIAGGQHPVLPFNEWINTLTNNYETLVVDGGDETEGLSAESSAAALEVSDEMVANAVSDELSAPPQPPPSPSLSSPLLPICEWKERHSPATDPSLKSITNHMSDQSLPTAETTNLNISRRQYRRRHDIDGQPMDPILGQYAYSAADGEYRCLLCQYRSRNRKPDNIRQHMVSHSDRRPYKCPLCPTTYKWQHVLSTHHRSRHQLLKPYVCPHEGCHKRYHRLQSLKDHIDGQHSPLRYRCLLDGCGRDRRPFACFKLLREHQRRRHYRRLAITDDLQPVLPFNEWIKSLPDNYDTVVVDVAKGLAADSSAEALEVFDDMVANADKTVPTVPPPSPPILPIRKAREVVATDTRRTCDGVDTDHNDFSGHLLMKLSLATNPIVLLEALSMSDQFLPSAETTNQSISRREYKRKKPAIDGEPTDPMLGQYSYSTADNEYRCQRCPYRNRRLDYIRQHMVRHSNSRRYQCPDCSAAYKRSNELKRHHRSCHQLLKPYVCPHDGCHKAYNQVQSLRIHIDGQHSPLRYRCLLTDCRRSHRRPFACLDLLRQHQRRCHYHQLVERDGQQPVLPFNEWIASVADNYDTVVVDVDETEGLFTDSSKETLEVSDDIAANAVINEVSAPPPLRPPPSPPILPVCKGPQSVPTDGRRACYGVDTDHNHISGQLSMRRRGNQRLDHYSLGPSKTPQLVYECNFDSCQYTSGVFEEIADHFVVHWDHYNRDLGLNCTDDCD